MTDESRVLTIQPGRDPKKAGTVTYTMRTSVGGRSSQQDSLFAAGKEDSLLAVLCDGMGGMNGGELASGLAVKLLAEAYFEENISSAPKFYHDMALRLDEAVYALSAEGARLQAGTTIVSVMVDPTGVYWLSVGDSRIYLYRGGSMLCPVPAHNYRLLLDQMLASGRIDREQYRKEEGKAEALISYLGLGGISRMEINQRPFLPEPGDQILLCSDGLYKSLPDERILAILELNVPPEAKAEILVGRAVEAGGRSQDNTSVILLEF